MVSDVQNLIAFGNKYFGVSSSDTLMFLSIAFCAFCGLFVLDKVKNDYAAIAAVFVPLTFCTILQFVSPIPYFIICAVLSILIMRKMIGG